MCTQVIQQELSLYQRLDHPNVVQYLGHDYDQDKEGLYIFLEFVAGGSLANLVRDFGALGDGVVRTYTKQIVEGLVYVHSQGWEVVNITHWVEQYN